MNDVDEIIGMLDHLTDSGVSRMKIETSEEHPEGDMKKTYHHGRCDVGSPFVTGRLYDLGEEGE